MELPGESEVAESDKLESNKLEQQLQQRLERVVGEVGGLLEAALLGLIKASAYEEQGYLGASSRRERLEGTAGDFNFLFPGVGQRLRGTCGACYLPRRRLCTSAAAAPQRRRRFYGFLQQLFFALTCCCQMPALLFYFLCQTRVLRVSEPVHTYKTQIRGGTAVSRRVCAESTNPNLTP